MLAPFPTSCFFSVECSTKQNQRQYIGRKTGVHCVSLAGARTTILGFLPQCSTTDQASRRLLATVGRGTLRPRASRALTGNSIQKPHGADRQALARSIKLWQCGSDRLYVGIILFCAL